MSGDARQELLNRLTEMVGGRPPTAVPVLPGKPGQDGQPSSPLQAGPKKAKKTRPWDREILRDCPSVQRFKEFTSEERKGDRVTSRLISIVCGAISRGRHQGISVEDMAHAILPLAETDIQAVRVLWPRTASDVVAPPPADNSQSGGAPSDSRTVYDTGASQGLDGALEPILRGSTSQGRGYRDALAPDSDATPVHVNKRRRQERWADQQSPLEEVARAKAALAQALVRQNSAASREKDVVQEEGEVVDYVVDPPDDPPHSHYERKPPPPPPPTGGAGRVAA